MTATRTNKKGIKFVITSKVTKVPGGFVPSVIIGKTEFKMECGFKTAEIAQTWADQEIPFFIKTGSISTMFVEQD
jgi:hypothetical protein